MTGALDVRIAKRMGDFELDVAFSGPGEGVTALFGPSGAGKSLTLAAVAGALRPDVGRVTLDGRALYDSGLAIDVAMERRRIGWVFQDGRLFPHLDVRANLLYGARRGRGRAARARWDEVVDTLGLAPLLQRSPSTLSGGERQRTAIGRALLSQPDLLLMDEPLAALDLPRRAEVLPYLERLKSLSRLPILYVTHALAEVTRLADWLVVLQAGRVIAQGPVAEVMGREDIPLLAGRPDAGSVLLATLAGHDAERGLSRLAVGPVELVTPPIADLAPGAAVRAVVLARDVLLATVRPEGLSARNVLPAVIEAVAPPRPDGVVLVRVRLAGEGPTILSAVTRDAVEALGLAPGRPVYTILKSVAVEGVGPGGLLAELER